MDKKYEQDQTLISKDDAIVRFKLDETSGQILEEAWYNEEDQLHSYHGKPAYIEFHKSSGNLKLSRWMYQGQLHRWPENKPAEVFWSEDGNSPIQMSFFRLGKLHRDHNRPARIWKCPAADIIIREEFWRDGKLHRDNGLPAIIEYDQSRGDTVKMSEFYVNGKKITNSTIHPKP